MASALRFSTGDGIVYCLAHSSWPHLVKIGYTMRSVRERMKELNNEGIPGEFKMVCAMRVPCAFYCEQLMHTHLAGFRRTHEFFEIEPRLACSIFGIVRSLVGGVETNEFDHAMAPRIQIHGIDQGAQPMQEAVVEEVPARRWRHGANANGANARGANASGKSIVIEGEEVVVSRSRLWRRRDEEELMRLWREEKSFDEIASSMNRSKRAVCFRLVKLHYQEAFLSDVDLAQCMQVIEVNK